MAEHDFRMAWSERRVLSLAAFVFVVLSLILLALTPAILLDRISSATREITTTILPADRGIRHLALAMQERIAASRSRILTGDPVYSRRLE